jgi:hypothetical protein
MTRLIITKPKQQARDNRGQHSSRRPLPPSNTLKLTAADRLFSKSK